MKTRTLITDVEDMRAYISDVYKGERWKHKVARMPDAQVMAIYFSFMDRIRKKKRGEAQPGFALGIPGEVYEQVSFDDYLENKSLEEYLR